MLYKTITKDDFKKMVEILIENNEVIGPKWRDRDSEGNKIYRFLKLLKVVELQEAVNLIPFRIPIPPFRAKYIVVLHKALDHLFEIVFGYRHIKHSSAPDSSKIFARAHGQIGIY